MIFRKLVARPRAEIHSLCSKIIRTERVLLPHNFIEKLAKQKSIGSNLETAK